MLLFIERVKEKSVLGCHSVAVLLLWARKEEEEATEAAGEEIEGLTNCAGCRKGEGEEDGGRGEAEDDIWPVSENG